MAERPLSHHVLYWTLPFVLTVTALISASTYLIARTIILDQLEQGARQEAATAAAQVKSAWDQDRNSLLTVAQSPLFLDYVKNRDFELHEEAEVYRREIERTLLDLSRRIKTYPRLRFVDARGREVALVQDGTARPRSPAPDAALLDAARALRPGEAASRGPYTAAWHRARVVSWSAGVFDRRGALVGVVAIDASFEAISELLGRFRIGRSGRVYTLGHERAPPDSDARVTATARVEGTPLTVVFTVDRDEFIRPLWVVGGATVVLGAFALVLLALGLWRQFDVLLRPTEERYRNAIENSPQAVISLDQNLRVTLWNRRAEALFGWQPTEAYGRALSFVFADREFDRLKREVDIKGAVRQAEAVGLTREGRRLDLSVSWTGQTSPSGAREWFIVLQDETEKKRLQTQLIQAEKLSAVGTLIAGVAHELNNPLAAVIGFADMLKATSLDAEEREDLGHLRASATRCKDIVQGLLSFVRQGKALRQRVSLNHLAHATIGLLEYRLVKTEGIRVDVALDRSAPAVGGDFSRIQQILVNLLTNSADALRGRSGPRVVRVLTRALPDGSELVVEDTGPGVDPQIRSRLFEPFVTTKPVGIGTGLGLSISAKSAQELGGELRHEDAPGGGARFIARFPLCPAGLQEADSALNLPPACPGARVLVVDDEPDLAQLIRRILAEDGMEPVAVADAGAAREALARADFALVISDIDLGPSKGFALYDELDAAPARPAFLFLTGDVLNESLRLQATARGVPVLTKPFLRTDLLRAARRAARGGPMRPDRPRAGGR